MSPHLATGSTHIGISGWRYQGWRGSFYPPGLPRRLELQHASRIFNSIEINGTHYSLLRPSSFEQWRDATPDGFTFALKGSRFITHMLKLRGAEGALANFFAQGVLALGPKMGPILWQFAPRFAFDAERLSTFFDLLPRTTTDVAALAHEHGPRLKGRAFTEALVKQPVRHCIEIRHDSFVCPEFIALLRKHNIGLVVADTVEWPLLFDVTSDFVYCRLHGSEELYASGYGDAALDTWAKRVVRWAHGEEAEDETASSRLHGHHASPTPARKRQKRDVFVYFDNDAKVHAPYDAQALQRRVEKLHTAKK
ncbi:DUF72 domain-containing protein [Terriglobus roseus]|nr:DUF72 domain-containing protein [Terriglobus roseus]